MRKFLFAFLLMAIPLLAQQPAATVKLLNAVTAVGNGTPWVNNAGAQWLYAVIHVTGAPTGCSVIIQTATTTSGTYQSATASTASGFDSNPFTCTGTATDGIVGVYCPASIPTGRCATVRGRVATLSGGTSPTVTVTLYAFPVPQTITQLTGTLTVTANQGTGAANNDSPWVVSLATPNTVTGSGGLSSYTSGASYVASLATSSGVNQLFYGFSVYNSAGASQFYLCFNSAALPANGTASVTTPVNCPSASTCSFSIGPIPIKTFTAGVVCANSSTSPTLTTGAADSFFQILLK
jgi:hypothetical protein